VVEEKKGLELKPVRELICLQGKIQEAGRRR